MMKCFRSRTGSALLVVLGMLSFMLFSGLAFSVYMRYSRLPTSFLRRTTTTRQLTKAALAEAIEHIDQAIGNDPHPGVRAAGKAFKEDELDNFWSHRVFIGVGTTGSDKNASTEQPADGSIRPAYADADETVATLTLEGLAYLPPKLINEARYYSKRTPTARWHPFWFDSGRYAYTAIDVSDYFDVNRIVADKYPRAACGSRRLSFAHLFETDGHEKAGTDGVKWDKFMDKFRKINDDDDSITFNTVPLVSLADFNIGFEQAKVGDLKCPFYDFINQNGIPYDCGETTDDPDAEAYRGMTFVTDGWFPKPDRAADKNVLHCSLENPKYQPFKKSELERENAKYSIDDIATYGHSDQGMQTWAVTTDNELRLNHLNFAALWDYLDVDSVPVSLCIPTVERTPMICGVRPSVNAANIDLTVVKDPQADVKGETRELDGTKWDYYSREVTYSLDAAKLQDAVNGTQVLLTYPFQEHGRTENLSRNFKVDGRVSVFLSDAGTGGDTVPIRPTKFTAYLQKNTIDKAEVTEKSLLSFPLMSQSVTPQSIVSQSAKKEMPCMMMALTVGSANFPADQLKIAKVKYTWPRDKHEVDETTGVETITTVNPDPILDSTKEYYQQTTVDSVTDTNLHPLQSTGASMDDNSVRAKFQSKDGAIKLKANIAVWVRVTDRDGNTVDLVPASQHDDENFIGCQTSRVTELCSGDYSKCPLMRLVATDPDGSLEYSLKSLNAGKLGTISLPDTKWIISDPRYNHSPENWVKAGDDVAAGGELQTADWTDNQVIKAMVEDGDGDVFMSTSDVGYMQSVYELAFLPRTSNGFSANGRGNPFYGSLNVQFSKTDFPTKFSEAQDYNNSSGKRLMWRTYSPMDASGEFTELETIFEPGEGMTVNPYSDDKKVLMAAFANTPHDWRVAATNDDSIFSMTAAEFNKQHAWNAYSSEETGKVCWDCLEEFAGAFSEDARSTRDWESAFRNLGWSKDKRKLLDDLEELEAGEDSDLYSVDKKFLYGFWHDCFAVRQQLFLIFVRAEPMMMGGGVKGQVPPQLGARAVALVWRDPAKTAARGESGSTASSLAYPHRTRILFYHQFD